MSFIFENGITVKDKITGFKGLIVGRAYYLGGCNKYALQPPMKKDGGIEEIRWFDEGRLELVKGGKKVNPSDVQAEKNGCDITPPSA